MSFLPFLNLIPQLPDFAGAGMNYAVGAKTFNRQKSAIRHLRRREYQDMMFSMKAAGLNPMLASGATPGHQTAMMNVPPSQPGSAGIGSTALHAAKMPSEVELTKASTASKVTEAQNLLYQRANMLQTGENIAADTRLKNQGVLESGAREAAARQAAIKDGASAKEIAARESLIRQDIGGRIGGSLHQDPIGYIGAAAKKIKIGMAKGGERFVEESGIATSAKELRRWLKEEEEKSRKLFQQNPGRRNPGRGQR